MSPKELIARGDQFSEAAKVVERIPRQDDLASYVRLLREIGHSQILRACLQLEEAILDYEAAEEKAPRGKADEAIAAFRVKNAKDRDLELKTLLFEMTMPIPLLINNQTLRKLLYTLLREHGLPTAQQVRKKFKEYKEFLEFSKDDIERIVKGFEGRPPLNEVEEESPRLRPFVLPSDGAEVNLPGFGPIGQVGHWVLNRPRGAATERPVFNLEEGGLRHKDRVQWSEIASYLERDNAELQEIVLRVGIRREQVLLIILERMRELLVEALKYRGELVGGVNSFENGKYTVFMSRLFLGRPDVTIKYEVAEGHGAQHTLRLNNISIYLALMGIFYKGTGGWDQHYPNSPKEFWQHHVQDHFSRLLKELQISEESAGSQSHHSKDATSKSA